MRKHWRATGRRQSCKVLMPIRWISAPLAANPNSAKGKFRSSINRQKIAGTVGETPGTPTYCASVGLPEPSPLNWHSTPQGLLNRIRRGMVVARPHMAWWRICPVTL